MRLQGRTTTANVRLTTDLPNIRPVRLQVGPGLTFTLSAREATALATALVAAVDQLKTSCPGLTSDEPAQALHPTSGH
jgi:hypothetical protein